MKGKFNKIFLESIRIIHWLEGTGFLGIPRAGNILFGMIIVIGSIINFLEGVNEFLERILLGLLMITTFSLLFVLSLRFYWIKPPKFIRQETENPAQLFDRFSHWSFLYGIFVYSFFTSIFIVGTSMAFVEYILNSHLDFSKIFYNLFFFNSAVFLVFYFMYHVAVKDVPTKVIKERILLYLAIMTTITAGLFGLSLKEVLFPLITYLGIGVAWLSFFVEKIESET